jgi:hypothetical protein
VLNKIFPLTLNKVGLDFEFSGDFAIDGLNNFTELKLFIGQETYSTLDNPSNLVIRSKSKLVLDIAGITSLEDGPYFVKILGFLPNRELPYQLTSECGGELAHPVIVCS